MVFPKKSRWNIIFLSCIIEKDDISFSRKYDFTPDGKWKMIFLKKIHENMIFSSNVLKSGLFRKCRAGTWFLSYYLEKWYFFSRKHDIFSLGGTREMTLLKKFMEIWYFLCTQRAGVTKVAPRPSVKKKNQRWSYRAKIHLKVIDVLDWHSRKRSAILCAFTETFTGVFMYCSPAKKNQET